METDDVFIQQPHRLDAVEAETLSRVVAVTIKDYRSGDGGIGDADLARLIRLVETA